MLLLRLSAAPIHRWAQPSGLLLKNPPPPKARKHGSNEGKRRTRGQSSAETTARGCTPGGTRAAQLQAQPAGADRARVASVRRWETPPAVPGTTTSKRAGGARAHALPLTQGRARRTVIGTGSRWPVDVPGPWGTEGGPATQSGVMSGADWPTRRGPTPGRLGIETRKKEQPSDRPVDSAQHTTGRRLEGNRRPLGVDVFFNIRGNKNTKQRSAPLSHRHKNCGPKSNGETGSLWLDWRIIGGGAEGESRVTPSGGCA